jgi:hypothetical protein
MALQQVDSFYGLVIDYYYHGFIITLVIYLMFILLLKV